MMHSATSPRIAIAFFSALAASRNFIQEPIEHPLIQPERKFLAFVETEPAFLGLVLHGAGGSHLVRLVCGEYVPRPAVLVDDGAKVVVRRRGRAGGSRRAWVS